MSKEPISHFESDDEYTHLSDLVFDKVDELLSLGDPDGPGYMGQVIFCLLRHSRATLEEISERTGLSGQIVGPILRELESRNVVIGTGNFSGLRLNPDVEGWRCGKT